MAGMVLLPALVFLIPVAAFVLYVRAGFPVWEWSEQDDGSARVLGLMAYQLVGAFVVVMLGVLANGIYQTVAAA